LLKEILDFFLHLDQHLENILREYESTAYVILCLIIFCETGLVATPFLPGDSLLFAAGAIIAKTGILNVWLLIPLLFLSAIAGDNTNYFIGRFVGHKVFEIRGIRKIVKKKYLDQTTAEKPSSSPGSSPSSARSPRSWPASGKCITRGTLVSASPAASSG
jgi:membrane-associated protein